MGASEGLGPVFLFVGPQARRFGAFFAAAAFQLLRALWAGEKELIAVHVGAIVIHIRRDWAMAAMADDLFRLFVDRHGKAVVEDKKLAPPLILPFFEAIINYSAI